MTIDIGELIYNILLLLALWGIKNELAGIEQEIRWLREDKER